MTSADFTRAERHGLYILDVDQNRIGRVTKSPLGWGPANDYVDIRWEGCGSTFRYPVDDAQMWCRIATPLELLARCAE